MNHHQQTARVIIGLALLVGLIVLMALYNGAAPIDPVASSVTGSVSSSLRTPNAKLPAGSLPAPRSSEITRVKWIWKTTVLADGTVISPKQVDAFTIVLGTDGRVQGTTDCNGFGGDYTMGSDGIVTFSSFMSTEMYCGGSQEQDFTSHLMNGSLMSIDATGSLIITIKDNGGQIVFTK